jgi:hypothetical protein
VRSRRLEALKTFLISAFVDFVFGLYPAYYGRADILLKLSFLTSELYKNSNYPLDVVFWFRYHSISTQKG